MPYLKIGGPGALQRALGGCVGSYYAYVGSMRPGSARTAELQLHGGSTLGESCSPPLPALHSANKIPTLAQIYTGKTAILGAKMEREQLQTREQHE